jgi:hypothetical protein
LAADEDEEGDELFVQGSRQEHFEEYGQGMGMQG